MSVVCCQVQTPAPGRSLGQKSPVERGVSEYDNEASIMRRPYPLGAVAAGEKKDGKIPHCWT